MSLLIGTKNTTTQTIVAGGIINLGAVYRKYCKKNCCGVKCFEFNGTSISLQHQGIYHVTAMFESTGAVGAMSIQLLENGVVIPGAYSSQSITVADTQQRNFVIDYYVLVDNVNVLNQNLTSAKSISFQTGGVDGSIINAVVNIEKVV